MSETETEIKEEVSRRKQLDEWFDFKLLPIYGNPQKVEQARREMHRWQPPDDVLEKIIQWVLADNRARRDAKRKGGFYREPCNLYTFFHESRWMDKLQPVDEVPRSVNPFCLLCGVETKYLYPVDGKLGCIKCYDTKHHPDFKAQVYKNLCDRGLGKTKEETKEQWLKRIKETGLKSIRQLQFPKNAE